MNRHEDFAARCFARKAGAVAPGGHFAHHHESPFMTRRFLRPALLLLLAEEPSHGYALLDKLAEMGVADKRMPLPIVYRILRHLEREGLAVSDQVTQEGRGPARKVYRLTDDGMRALSGLAESMQGVAELISEFQSRYEALKKREG